MALVKFEAGTGSAVDDLLEHEFYPLMNFWNLQGYLSYQDFRHIFGAGRIRCAHIPLFQVELPDRFWLGLEYLAKHRYVGKYRPGTGCQRILFQLPSGFQRTFRFGANAARHSSDYCRLLPRLLQSELSLQGA